MNQEKKILVLNSGSSSIKFNFYDGKTEKVSGQISGLGAQPHIELQTKDGTVDLNQHLDETAGASHETALAALLDTLEHHTGVTDVDAVGHRVVHGGVGNAAPRIIDASMLQSLEELIPLAPLHQPHNLAGIYAARTAFPNAIQAACFDTSFHRKHAWVNDTFALPRSYYDEGIRRYGFHGLSYEYICAHLKSQYPSIFAGRVVVAHLGNGASMCAIRNGQSIGSTMGFTALDGLPMGTRCGQLDPGVVLYLMQSKGMNADQIADLLYKQSGLKGMSGISQDMRELSESDDPAAIGAIDYFVFRIRREIGAMAAALNGINALVFTGGIGENSAMIRERVCQNQEWLGLGFDPKKNNRGEELVSTDTSRVQVLTIPTNEEEMIRRHTSALL